MPKSPDAFRTISEVADWLGIQAHVLRFWESKFTQVKPIKRAGGRRYYRPADMQLLGGIKKLLHEDGLTIKGVQKILREEGMSHVAAMSVPLDEADAELDMKPAPAPAKAKRPDPIPEPQAVVLPFEAPKEAKPEAARDTVEDVTEAAPTPQIEESAKASGEDDPTPHEPELQLPETSGPGQDETNSADTGHGDQNEAPTETAEPEHPQAAPTTPDNEIKPEDKDAQRSEAATPPQDTAPPEQAADPLETQTAPQAHTEPDAGAEDEAESLEPAGTAEKMPPSAAAPPSPHEAPEETETAPDNTPSEPPVKTPQPEDAAADMSIEAEDKAEDTAAASEPTIPANTAPSSAEPEKEATTPDHEPTPKPRDIGMPDLTPEAEIAADPAALAGVYKLRRMDSRTAEKVAPLLAQLTALRDRMASPRTGTSPKT